MKDNAKAQHEVDKANFNENRDSVTFKKANENAAESWTDAKLFSKECQEKMQSERDEQIAAAKERNAAAKERIKNAKNGK